MNREDFRMRDRRKILELFEKQSAFWKQRSAGGMMKKWFAFIILCIVLASFIGCDTEPLFTDYGEAVHQSVRKHYDNYEILAYCRIEKDGVPTLHNFYMINDMQDGIDVLCISYKRSNENDGEYTSSEVIVSNNVEFGKSYCTEGHLDDIAVEYLICEKNDIPTAALQSEKFKCSGKTLYLCILNVTDTE